MIRALCIHKQVFYASLCVGALYARSSSLACSRDYCFTPTTITNVLIISVASYFEHAPIHHNPTSRSSSDAPDKRYCCTFISQIERLHHTHFAKRLCLLSVDVFFFFADKAQNSTLRHPPSFSRTFSPRSFTTSLNTSPASPNIPNQLKKLELKLEAVKYCLDNVGFDKKPKIDDEGFRKMVQRYEGSDKKYLQGMLKDLQHKETALIISQAAIESKGTLTSS